MSDKKYRTEIDGIRALAVVAVVLFHLDKDWLPGGFTGVDVFFVISGYLITGIVYAESLAGKFSFLRFYQRRIARIFPLQVLTTCAILIAAFFIYSPQDFASAGALALFSAASLTNVKLMFQGNYFEVSPDAQPFLHYWSLAVEEQFYMFLPLLVFASWRFGLSKRSVLISLCLISIASLGLCIYLTQFKPTWAFYLLPTRAWELLAGALLALMDTGSIRFGRTVQKEILSLLGLALIIGSFFLLRESYAFPGFIAVIPVLGTTLLIYGTAGEGQFCKRLLSLSALGWIGKLSYSIYLWHWPIFCFVDYQMFAYSEFVRSLTKVVLTLAFSIGSYYCYENPLRRIFSTPSRRPLCYSLFVVCTISIVCCGYAVRTSMYYSSTVAEVLSGGKTRFVGEKGPTVVLMGDSNASMYGGLLWNMAGERRFNLHVISVDAGDPLPGSELYKNSIEFLRSCKPVVTIYVIAWGAKVPGHEEDLRHAVQEILQYSQYVVLVEQPPILPEGINRQSIRDNGYQAIYEAVDSERQRNSANLFLRSFQDERVHLIQTEAILKKPDGELMFVDDEDRQLFHDRAHLSGFGAERLRPMIDSKLSELVDR